jgi:hypothetical protein
VAARDHHQVADRAGTGGEPVSAIPPCAGANARPDIREDTPDEDRETTGLDGETGDDEENPHHADDHLHRGC